MQVSKSRPQVRTVVSQAPAFNLEKNRMPQGKFFMWNHYFTLLTKYHRLGKLQKTKCLFWLIGVIQVDSMMALLEESWDGEGFLMARNLKFGCGLSLSTQIQQHSITREGFPLWWPRLILNTTVKVGFLLKTLQQGFQQQCLDTTQDIQSTGLPMPNS